MEILLVTIFISTLLVLGFVVFFLFIQSNPESDHDRESLMPLEEDRIQSDRNHTKPLQPLSLHSEAP